MSPRIRRVLATGVAIAAVVGALAAYELPAIALNPQPLPPGAAINPQPLPPASALNPQPLPPGGALKLNPQPLPPGGA